MEEELNKAIDVYSKALAARMKAKKALHSAQMNDQKTRNGLSSAREDLRQLEREMDEYIYTEALIPSTLIATPEPRPIPNEGQKIK